jgi:hypothetical protein
MRKIPDLSKRTEMPLTPYFLFVGGVLLTLLLVANAVLPQLPANEGIVTSAEVPVIRIHSDRKGPAAVVFDTNQPTIVPATVAKAETAAPAPAAVADLRSKAQEREAFALLEPPQPNAAAATKPKRPEPKASKRRIAKARANRPLILVARQPQIGWGNNGWNSGWSGSWRAA